MVLQRFRQGGNPMKKLLSGGAVLCSVFLVSCGGIDMYQEGTLNHTRMQVESQSFSDNVSVEDVNDHYLQQLAQHYSKYGSGAMDVLVTYDARSYHNTAMKAGETASYISKTLRQNGVSQVDVGVLPVKSQGDYSRVIFSYEGYSASAPEGCGNLLPGLDGDAVENDPDYKLGCTLDTMLARQVSRPSDLMGRGVEDATTEGRSATNIVDLYRSGAPNEPLNGERASGE